MISLMIIIILFVPWLNKLDFYILQAPFDLLYCDSWGPHKVPTHSRARFFLTIVDDFTRCTWIFLMQYKSETQQILKSFIDFARTLFHACIKAIRVDNDSEFLSMRNLFRLHGGVVERRHCHILIEASALVFQSQLG